MNHIDVIKTDIEYLLAKIIREVDGDNALGASQLAEKIVNEMINRLTKSQLERLAEARSKAIEEAEKIGPKTTVNYSNENIMSIPHGTKLYTASPQRQWVGLTDEEIDLWKVNGYERLHEKIKDFVRFVEAKLKEKNT